MYNTNTWFYTILEKYLIYNTRLFKIQNFENYLVYNTHPQL